MKNNVDLNDEIDEVYKVEVKRPFQKVSMFFNGQKKGGEHNFKNSNSIAIESHLEFFWWHGSDLDDKNLQPYPIRNLIKNYLNGKNDVWWESSLNLEIDDSNRS
ncbi:hypothetical protein [Neobacillus sp. DY30]|uniref:hypothetical protein n=1 Tax=Neobacillus sp. DY30 TaxID=3047871 RepID=UPI0024BF92C6|nr:hypothetical protein [Neobacillus sp. DY30]WHX98076.1 hypothetical protein QNH29_15500 [Neobacillus sp. DY30]